MLLCLVGFSSICCFSRISALGALAGFEFFWLIPFTGSPPSSLFLYSQPGAAFSALLICLPPASGVALLLPSPGLECPLLSVLTNATSLLSACPSYGPLFPVPGFNLLLCPVMPPRTHRTPSHLRSAVAGGPHPVFFSLSFSVWLVGWFYL